MIHSSSKENAVYIDRQYFYKAITLDISCLIQIDHSFSIFFEISKKVSCFEGIFFISERELRVN